jgi:lysozyme family protein
VTTGQRWLFVGFCLAIAVAVNFAFYLARRRRLARRTERTTPCAP